eukprot:1153405-Pelagomonas_calceolata.AAC.3
MAQGFKGKGPDKQAPDKQLCVRMRTLVSWCLLFGQKRVRPGELLQDTHAHTLTSAHTHTYTHTHKRMHARTAQLECKVHTARISLAQLMEEGKGGTYGACSCSHVQLALPLGRGFKFLVSAAMDWCTALRQGKLSQSLGAAAAARPGSCSPGSICISQKSRSQQFARKSDVQHQSLMKQHEVTIYGRLCPKSSKLLDQIRLQWDLASSSP